MATNAKKLKGMMEKTKTLKEELKGDIAYVDQQIDDLVAKLAT